MANSTIAIDAESRDMSFSNGEVVTVSGNEALLQNILNTLLVYKGEFEKDSDHGTDYDSIFNDDDVTDEEVIEIVRDAIFQEPYVQSVDEITVSRERRAMSVYFEATLYTGDNITARVVI